MYSIETTWKNGKTYTYRGIRSGEISRQYFDNLKKIANVMRTILFRDGKEVDRYENEAIK